MELLNPETETLRDTRDKIVFKLQDFEFSFYCIKLKKKKVATVSSWNVTLQDEDQSII